MDVTPVSRYIVRYLLHLVTIFCKRKSIIPSFRTNSTNEKGCRKDRLKRRVRSKATQSMNSIVQTTPRLKIQRNGIGTKRSKEYFVFYYAYITEDIS